jgi:hypothetical protein
MESPGPGYGHRGFLVQRNHESGDIVIVYSVPEKCGFGNSAISTFCHRDIFAMPNSAGVVFIMAARLCRNFKYKKPHYFRFLVSL